VQKILRLAQRIRLRGELRSRIRVSCGLAIAALDPPNSPAFLPVSTAAA